MEPVDARNQDAIVPVAGLTTEDILTFVPDRIEQTWP